MSSSLHIVANHHLDFSNKSLEQVGIKVCELLKTKLQLPNEDFVRQAYAEKCKIAHDTNMDQLSWTHTIAKSTLYGGLEESDFLQIKSNWQLDLIVEEGYLIIFPIIHKTKHYHWFNYSPKTHPFEDIVQYQAYQNQWSMAIKALIAALGGDKAFVLADSAYDHNYYNASSFEDIEQILLGKCGSPQTEHNSMAYDPDADDALPYFKIQ